MDQIRNAFPDSLCASALLVGLSCAGCVGPPRCYHTLGEGGADYRSRSAMSSLGIVPMQPYANRSGSGTRI